MALDLQFDCTFTGPALPLPFVTLSLESELTRLRLLPRLIGDEGRAFDDFWTSYRAHLRQLVSQGGSVRVKNQVIDPLAAFLPLGYSAVQPSDDVQTREGRENGGSFLVTPDGARLRFWTAAMNEDLDAPARRGEAYRFSHTRIASRVLLASGERLGLLTNGSELRLLICDPARLDSSISIVLDASWKRARNVPDSFRLFVALAKPDGAKALPDLIEKARLQQVKVTKDLRVQARLAVEEFIQAVLDHPENQVLLAAYPDPALLARKLWREGLVTVYRLLFVLKLESTDDPAKCFSFASQSLWRNTFSPGVALAIRVRAVLDRGENTGSMLENGLRGLFRMLESGLQCTELNVKPMGGALFARRATPILSSLRWPEHGVACMLNRLLWTTPSRGTASRERVHYGPLDVEDLGRVYEALLELDPGIAAEPMCRLRRAKLEVVVPAVQGERYRPAVPVPPSSDDLVAPDAPDALDALDDLDDSDASSNKKTKVEWIEQIPPGRFYLRVGLGRKATGSFYTPHSFVRFLVQETLGPLVECVSPREKPQPAAILKLKVVDKAMGSGHFLVEGARFLGDALYEACRRCDDLAQAAVVKADAHRTAGDTAGAAAEDVRAVDFIRRVERLPDPDDELLRYLPSRAVEGGESGFSLHKAVALCRRMIAVHCLYGVDKNPLAVELAKLALWIECHAEGLPLTFLDHRLVVGDSLTGPFFEHLLKFPGTQQPLDDLFTQGLTAKLTSAVSTALVSVRELEATVGATVADIELKQAAKTRLDRALAPFRLLAAAWSGGVMLGPEGCDDDAYAMLARVVAETGDLPAALDENTAAIRSMIAVGLGLPDFAVCACRDEIIGQLNSPDCVPALSYDITFPEVFYPTSNPSTRNGFNADLGNPPWDQPEVSEPEYWAYFDLRAVEARLQRERDSVIAELRQSPSCLAGWQRLITNTDEQARIASILYCHQSTEVDGKKTVGRPDVFRLFAERTIQTSAPNGALGEVVPSAFHANEGTTGIRLLYLNKTAFRCCFSFENRKKLFEIHSSFKFALVVSNLSTTGTSTFNAAFYLSDETWLFIDKANDPHLLPFSRSFVERSGGAHCTFIECRSLVDFTLLESLYSNADSTWGTNTSSMNVSLAFGIELHRNKEYASVLNPPQFISDAWKTCKDEGWLRLPLLEGKCIGQYTDTWMHPIRVASPVREALSKRHWRDSTPFYRIAFRRIAASTNERTFICTLLPPGVICDNTLAVETAPQTRSNNIALALCAIGNSFPFDYSLRARVGATVNAFIIAPVPIPKIHRQVLFIVHSATRLTSNHSGFNMLWQEQFGTAWYEEGKTNTWPALTTNDTRWAVRAVIDAVVAQAYALNREQYAHVLSTFSHSSYRDAPSQCLAAFDELQRDGLETFTRRHDPYWDIPLNENLPQPAIDLPNPSAMAVHEAASTYANDLFSDPPTTVPARPTRRRRST
jgi:hypothetical protein